MAWTKLGTTLHRLSPLALAFLMAGPAAAQHSMANMAPKAKAAARPDYSAIVRDPSDVPPPVGARPAQVVRVLLTAQELTGTLNPETGVAYRYWTFNGKVPGPMIRVRVGDTVEVTLKNNADNHMAHSLDFHAALGEGGGMGLSETPPEQPGELSWGRTFTFVATTPGLFVYHCGTPVAAEHIANGMFGLILVEPAGGLPRVDREYYVMQSEIYTAGPGKKGDTLEIDEKKLFDEQPQYFVFNGALDSLTKQYPLHAAVGQKVRIFFGNAGPNFTSSPHVIGEIFSKYYEYGSLLTPPMLGVQTGRVPPGSAAILEITAAAPGNFVFVDHALARVEKGLVGYLSVTGPDTAHLMYPGPEELMGQVPALAMTAADARASYLADVSTAPVATASLQPVSLVGVATTKVSMTDMSFVPATIEIKAGQAVTWVNTSGTMHTVVDNSSVALNPGDVAVPVGASAFASPFLQSGASYSQVFNTPGIYRYVCTQHERSGMVGVVIVKAAGAAPVTQAAHLVR